MSSQERDELARALERARREGVQIAARGIRRSDGARVFGVTSTSAGAESGVLRMVVVLPERLECSCPARVICKHRGVVYEELQAERERELQASVAAAAADAKRAEQELALRRESSPPAHDEKPFSLYK
jgi:hypothetical protein